MGDFHTYSYTAPIEIEFDFDWIIRKLESLARSNPNADFRALANDAVTAYVDWAYSATDLDTIVDDVIWGRRDDCAKIAAKYSNTCTLF